MEDPATGEEEGGVPDLQEQHVRMIKELNQQDAMDAGPEPAEGAVGGGLQPRTRATSGNIPGAEVVAAERRAKAQQQPRPS
uniref:Aminopeptidase n=1 Tax=Oryza nivara TaxID=4536 RepID=A0A0E0IBI9_ORYNI